MPFSEQGLHSLELLGDWELETNAANMAVTMYAFLEAILLLVNAVAVLNEERFLAKIGWGRDQVNQPQGFGHEEKGIKQQIANLIHAIRTVMRVPLIFLNAVAIVLELLMG